MSKNTEIDPKINLHLTTRLLACGSEAEIRFLGSSAHEVSLKSVQSRQIITEALKIITLHVRACVLLETVTARVESEADEGGVLV